MTRLYIVVTAIEWSPGGLSQARRASVKMRHGTQTTLA